ncbi:hypothetical protein MalM25_16050 [Planctomycetes bacterium MalM25]|nr:hypothetical protein MalM25_16050 [Planctomycetes bacterium MalM25]
MGSYISTIAAGLALLAIAVFSVQNLGAVEISFLFWSMTVSKCLVVIGAYLFGMISGWGLVELTKKFFAGGGGA